MDKPTPTHQEFSDDNTPLAYLITFRSYVPGFMAIAGVQWTACTTLSGLHGSLLIH